jgi:hypothetical protein
MTEAGLPLCAYRASYPEAMVYFEARSLPASLLEAEGQENDHARGWLVLEEADTLIGKGNRNTALRLLDRNRDLLTSPAMKRRDELLRRLCALQPEPGGADLDRFAAWLGQGALGGSGQAGRWKCSPATGPCATMSRRN